MAGSLFFITEIFIIFVGYVIVERMNLIRRLSVLMISTAILTACGKDACGTGQQPEEPETPEIRAFTEGADISWSTEMEGKGMKLMIDFHYSDSWADPGKQNIPESWKSYGVTQMTAAVYDHTKDILNTLESNGIDVEWVQVGNEVNSGMLWPSGKVKGESAENFVKYTNAGYDAVKSVYPDAKVILHVSNGHDSDLFSWFFGLMKKNNAKYDMIGMSLYPSWWEDGGWTKGWKAYNRFGSIQR